jgi:hypothetical protein
LRPSPTPPRRPHLDQLRHPELVDSIGHRGAAAGEVLVLREALRARQVSGRSQWSRSAPRIPARIQRQRAEVGPTSGPTWRLQATCVHCCQWVIARELLSATARRGILVVAKVRDGQKPLTLIFCGTPLRTKPRSAEKTADRTPMVTFTASDCPGREPPKRAITPSHAARAHTKTTQRDGLIQKTLRALRRPGQARTVVAVVSSVASV